MADLARIKNNVRKMVAQDAPESDIDAYIASEGVTIDDVRAFRPDGATAPAPSERVSAGFAAVPEGEIPQQSRVRQGRIVPFSLNLDTGETFFDPSAGIVGEIQRAVTLPGRVASGETQLRDPVTGEITEEAIGEAFNLAGVGAPASPRVVAGGAAARAVPTDQQIALEAAERLGVDLPRAVAGGPRQRAVGQVVRNVPVVGETVRAPARRAVGQLDAALEEAAGVGAQSRPVAGARVRRDVGTFVGDTLRQAEKEAYDAVDEFVEPFRRTPLRATARKAGEIAKRREAANLGKSGAIARVQKALDDPQGMTYDGLKTLRTSIGEELRDPGLLSRNISQDELNAIYGALTEDLRTAARVGGGRPALRQFERANALYRQNSRIREDLQRVVGKNLSDEAIFERIKGFAGTTGRADIRQLSRVKNAVGADTWREIQSAILADLGRGPDGAFSPGRFVTAYGKMSGDGKGLLFGSRKSSETRRALDDIVRVSQEFGKLREFANPSGTAQTVTGQVAGAALGGGGVAALAGLVDPLTILSTVGALGTGYGLGKFLGRPKTARSVANWAKAYENLVKNPTAAARRTLNRRAQALAPLVIAESGGEVSDVLPALLGNQPDQGSERPRNDDVTGGQMRTYDPRYDA